VTNSKKKIPTRDPPVFLSRDLHLRTDDALRSRNALYEPSSFILAPPMDWESDAFSHPQSPADCRGQRYDQPYSEHSRTHILPLSHNLHLCSGFRVPLSTPIVLEHSATSLAIPNMHTNHNFPAFLSLLCMDIMASLLLILSLRFLSIFNQSPSSHKTP